jgi:hypothetical protein
MDKEAKILSDTPVRSDSMLFKNTNQNYASLTNKYHLAYFPFYKFNDKSVKLDKKKKEELLSG